LVIGIVFQDTFLFHASIAEDLRYALPNASDTELISAATAASRTSSSARCPTGTTP